LISSPTAYLDNDERLPLHGHFLSPYFGAREPMSATEPSQLEALAIDGRGHSERFITSDRL